MYKVTDSKINISFWTNPDNYINIVPQMSKEISSNFDYKYRRHLIENRESNCNIAIDNNILCNNKTLNSDIFPNNKTMRNITFTDY